MDNKKIEDIINREQYNELFLKDYFINLINTYDHNEIINIYSRVKHLEYMEYTVKQYINLTTHFKTY